MTRSAAYLANMPPLKTHYPSQFVESELTLCGRTVRKKVRKLPTSKKWHEVDCGNCIKKKNKYKIA